MCLLTLGNWPVDIFLKVAYSENKKRVIMHKRWYDIEPTVCLAVSLIRSVDDNTQLKCADLIIDYAQERNVILRSNIIDSAFEYIMKRWYDKDERMSQAFDYFEEAPRDIQKEIALEVIKLLHIPEYSS